MKVASHIKHKRDRAKKEFTISSTDELKLLRKKYSDLISQKPMFFYHLPKDEQMKSAKEKYRNYDTSMDYLESALDEIGKKTRVRGRERISFSELLKNEDTSLQSNSRQISNFMKIKDDYMKKVEAIWESTSTTKYDKYVRYLDVKQCYINEIESIKFNTSTIRRLLLKIESTKQRHIASILFVTHKDKVVELLKKQKTETEIALRDDDGNIMIYGKTFKKIKM